MAKEEFIKITKARVHNLKNISLDIPKNKLIVVTGVSGSGKSSLAFDTLYAEGQRRYVESLSAYARQFLGVMQKPDVDKIENISPAISIDQRKAAHNPRSTVGTVTEIYDYLRLLFARIGVPHCPNCGQVVAKQTIDQMIEQLLAKQKGKIITILAPVVKDKKGEHKGVLQEIERAGFVKVRLDGLLYEIEDALTKEIDRKKKHSIEVVIDRLELSEDLDRARLADSLETGLKMGKGVVMVNHQVKGWNKKKKKISPQKGSRYLAHISEDIIFSEHFACKRCGISLPEIEPRLFSFNSPYGACPACQGLGKKLEVSPNLVVPNPDLSLAEGAIQPWMRASHKIGRQSYFWQQLVDLAERYDFSLHLPFKKLPQKITKLILYGEKAPISDIRYGYFEGVIPQLERRYRETDSEYTRAEIEQYMVEKKCEQCKGKRLKPEALAVKVKGKGIDELVAMDIESLRQFFANLNLDQEERKIAKLIVKEISNRLQFLIDVGVGYLTLERTTATLSGGEEERIRLATQIGTQLSGVLYILDEPSIGLHARDQGRLIETLKKLRDLGNTVLVVEHDAQTIKSADWVIDIGPGAGKHGGRVVFQGTPKQLLKSNTLTGDYLAGRKKIEAERASKSATSKNSDGPPPYLLVKGAREHNLKNIDVRIPLQKLVCITGVSGSGKSTLVEDILARALRKRFYRTKEEPGAHKEIIGLEHLDKVVLVDQSPIGRTPRSNPATYTGCFSHIRELFSKTREARVRGYKPGRFSFNVKGGRCEACEGQGVRKIEMYFLPDIYVECKECKGKRYNQETLEIEYRGKNIADVLEMTGEEALEFFKNIPPLYHKLMTLKRVGLGYLKLGQPAPSLSGGEAQRLKLAAELSKKATGRTLYILDEPTTGLHPDDIKKLLSVLRELVDRGNTVLLTEHELNCIKNADWIIDLGPEGGAKGGKIVAEGTPFEIAKYKNSYTGQYLKKIAEIR